MVLEIFMRQQSINLVIFSSRTRIIPDCYEAVIVIQRPRQ